MFTVNLICFVQHKSSLCFIVTKTQFPKFSPNYIKIFSIEKKVVLSDYNVSHHTLNFSIVLERVSKLPQARPWPPPLHHKDFVLNRVETANSLLRNQWNTNYATLSWAYCLPFKKVYFNPILYNKVWK